MKRLLSAISLLSISSYVLAGAGYLPCANCIPETQVLVPIGASNMFFPPIVFIGLLVVGLCFVGVCIVDIIKTKKFVLGNILATLICLVLSSGYFIAECAENTAKENFAGTYMIGEEKLTFEMVGEDLIWKEKNARVKYEGAYFVNSKNNLLILNETDTNNRYKIDFQGGKVYKLEKVS